MAEVLYGALFAVLAVNVIVVVVALAHAMKRGE
jgi:hypothetical protein